MRLLIVTPEYEPQSGGGILRYYGNLIPALARAGTHVTVLVAAPFGDDFPDYDATPAVRVACVRQAAISEAEAALSQFSATPEFRRWLAAGWAARRAATPLGSFDAVEATDFGLGFVPFVVDPIGAPLVVRCHGSIGQISGHEPPQPALELDHGLSRMAESGLLPCAGDLQTYAVSNAREWSGRLGREVTTVRPAMELSEPQGSAGDYAIVVGRVQAWKGPEILCEALRRLPVEGCPKFLWVGRDMRSAENGGSLDLDLGRRFPDVWGTRVRRQGACEPAAAQALISRARFVVVPSLWDVFNFTTIEAMACGKPVVCSTGAGAHELIESGTNGVLAEAGSATSLAEAIDRVASLSGAEAGRMGEAARETVRIELDPDAIATEHLDRYGRLEPTEIECDDWTRAFYSPTSGQVSLDYLEQVGIRRIAAYLSERLRRRVGGQGRAESAS